MMMRTTRSISALALLLFSGAAATITQNDKSRQFTPGHRRLNEDGGAFKMLGGVWLDSASAKTSDIESDCVKPDSGKGGSSSKKGKGSTSKKSKSSKSKSSKKSKGSGKGYHYCTDSPTAPDTVTNPPTTAPSLTSVVPPPLDPTSAPTHSVPSAPTPTVPPVPTAPIPTLSPAATTPDGGTVAPTPTVSPAATPPDGGPVAPTPAGPTIDPMPTAPPTTPSPAFPSVTLPPTVLAQPTSPDSGSLAPTPVPTVGATPCELYLAGLAPTSAPSQSVSVDIALSVNETFDRTEIMEDLLDFLNEEIGPLLVCSGQRRRQRRALQEDETTIVNLIFDQLMEDSSVSCDEVDTSQEGVGCLPINLRSILYYLGEYPIGFAAALRAAILNAISNIPGLISVDDVIVTSDAAPTMAPVIFVPSFGPTVFPTVALPLPTTSPTPAPANDFIGIEGPTADRSVDTGLSTTASVSLAVAGVAILLAIIFAVSRRRELDDDQVIKHRQITDDEDDGSFDRDVMEGGTVMSTPDRLVHIVGEDESDDSDEDDGREQPLYANQKLGQDPLSLTEMHALEGHSCASPTCEICELQRQSGVKFIPAAPHPFDEPEVSAISEATRKYAAADTVTL